MKALAPVMKPSMLRAAIVLVAGAVASCSGAQTAPNGPLTPLSESRALEIVRGVFAQQNVQAQLRRQIHVAGDRTMEVDVAIQGQPHGVEFVTSQDRVDLGDAIPRRQRATALLTMTGVGDDAQFAVLLLDDRDYVYEGDAERTSVERPSLYEVEDRLRRAVVDYITWLRQHGRL